MNHYLTREGKSHHRDQKNHTGVEKRTQKLSKQLAYTTINQWTTQNFIIQQVVNVSHHRRQFCTSHLHHFVHHLHHWIFSHLHLMSQQTSQHSHLQHERWKPKKIGVYHLNETITLLYLVVEVAIISWRVLDTCSSSSNMCYITALNMGGVIP